MKPQNHGAAMAKKNGVVQMLNCAINAPIDGATNVAVTPELGTSDCFGHFSASGTASKSGWTLTEVKVRGMIGSGTIADEDVRMGTTASPTGENWSSDAVLTAGCAGTTGCSNGASTVRSGAFYERDNNGMHETTEEFSLQHGFTGACVSVALRVAPAQFLGEPVYGVRQGEWLFYEIDPNVRGEGAVLYADRERLQATLLEAFVEIAEWHAWGSPLFSMHEALGTHALAIQSSAVRHATVFQGAIVLRQGPEVLRVISSMNREAPTRIQLRRGRPICVYPNVRSSTLRPHLGRIRVAIRVLR